MSAPPYNRSRIHPVIRYDVAALIGSFAVSAFFMGSDSSDEFIAFTPTILIRIFFLAITLPICAIAAFALRDTAAARFWFSSRWPAIAFIIIGAARCLVAIRRFPRPPKPDHPLEFIWIWHPSAIPAAILLLIGIAQFPYLLQPPAPRTAAEPQ